MPESPKKKPIHEAGAVTERRPLNKQQLSKQVIMVLCERVTRRFVAPFMQLAGHIIK